MTSQVMFIAAVIGLLFKTLDDKEEEEERKKHQDEVAKERSDNPYRQDPVLALEC